MRRKEILFKKLSFIIGIILIVSFVEGAEVTLPLRSEIKLLRAGGSFEETFLETIIKQEGEEVYVLYFWGRPDYMSGAGGGIRKGAISTNGFKIFWDTLNSFNFSQLREKYVGKKEFSNDISGYISFFYELNDTQKITKIVNFSVPRNCPVEFKRVYDLVESMGKFAQNPPDLKSILEYGDIGYKSNANEEIGRVKDPKYLDTLLILLPKKIEFADGIIRALGNIGNKKAIPIIVPFLINLDTSRLPQDTVFFFYLSREQLILTTLKAIISIDGRKNSKVIKHYLDEKYGKDLRGEVSLMLTIVNDYSGIPILIDLLGDPGLRGYVFYSLRRICYKNKRVITIFIKALEKEKKAKKLNDQRISGVTKGLYEITDQNFPYNQSDSIVAKKETINKWITWWEENKDKFK